MKNLLTALGLVLWATAAQAQTMHPEWSRTATIYEINTRQATAEGTFNALAKHLPRIKDLGVDILWFMPLQPIGVEKRKGKLGSYYSINDYTAINPEFGTEADFEQFVSYAHSLGFRIILDWVPNHTAWDHPWIDEHPEYYWKNEDGSISTALDDHNRPTDWTDVAELDYSNPALRDAMREEMAWWIARFQLDGFRCDMAGGVPYDFWQETNEHLRGMNPELFLLAESEFTTMPTAHFDMTYGWEFHHILNKVAGKGESVSKIDEYIEKNRANFDLDHYRMYFIDNHDENSWNGTVEKRIGANAHAAFVLCATLESGMPLIYNGQEVGLNKSLRFFERDTIDWSRPSEEAFYRTMLAFRKQNSALHNGASGGKQARIATNNSRVYAFSRNNGTHQAVVFVNFSNKKAKVKYSDAPAGTFTDAFTGQRITLRPSGKITLPANGFLVMQ
jgi:glycosidase